MERVAFLIDATGERIDCLLNPETFEVSRLAGVRPRGSASGQLVGAGLADDPLLFTGGGRTELTLDLLFDVDLVDEATRPADVRALTAPAVAARRELGRGRRGGPSAAGARRVGQELERARRDRRGRRAVRRVRRRRRAAPLVAAAQAGAGGRVGGRRPGPTSTTSWPPRSATPGAGRRGAGGRAGAGRRRRPTRTTPGCASTCWPPTRWAARSAGGCWPSTTSIANPLQVPPGTVLSVPPPVSAS